MSIKDKIYDQIDSDYEERLAGVLGISAEELSICTYNDNEENVNSDGIVMYKVIRFDPEHSPKEILDKIKGLNDDFCIWLTPDQIENYPLSKDIFRENEKESD